MRYEVFEIPAKAKAPLRVAAYCRVSTPSEEQQNSLETQVQYYAETISGHIGWTLAGIYAEQTSGTRFDTREAFNRMIMDCRKGKIDYIITKSVSRFGRNTLPFMQGIEELLQRGIPVHFELEGLNSSDWRMKKIITAAAAVAQRESESKSADIKWGIRHSFQEGHVKLNYSQFLGYTKDANGKLVVVEGEAEVVRLIYDLYLKGYGCRKIKTHLETNGIKTATGKIVWSTSTIDRILSNEKYIGTVLSQKTFVENCLTHKQMQNTGQFSKYVIEGNHEAIISKEVFEEVQQRKQGVPVR
ncbi:recombinase family protein [Ethanoligenens harbinense]|uniref:Resolvase domain n=1 Tax=Ethanoligenens harbinense (strain DSM 18485 / JCM 12961 / CGMCC 1.5033 / YUAN-3) TaxID=663278 RepID=E6U8W4_ETHHY|nr:recombinase family protein [Ethanoligenens harbinense]ADU27199.1 Resolvase domain [Ethanoligenens harbinense YUAN-3]AVQ96267.1 recombinase family protein [Ethanoligenens harbinense YUAN-3]AYF38926.1 recombinase family protein [Ethanoligenens harbinense]AYF41677.1 recombinase family protein [Ethanoligenens harbinense]QCN92508.1 recombinase family protein [Ethanoligenens harbinense]